MYKETEGVCGWVRMYMTGHRIMYSHIHWQELNLAVGTQIAIAKILADLNLTVQ